MFDSCALASQDSGAPGFTKLTVMMGGPHPPAASHSAPSAVLAHLQEHLRPRAGSDDRLPDPVFYEVCEQRDCIPTPGVGHLGRMDELRTALLQDPWSGKVKVIGASVDGVSVGDCIESGRRAAFGWE